MRFHAERLIQAESKVGSMKGWEQTVDYIPLFTLWLIVNLAQNAVVTSNGGKL